MRKSISDRDPVQ